MTYSAAPSEIDTLLSVHGRMNFGQDCLVDERSARLSMNERNVYLAITGGVEPVAVAPFDKVSSNGQESTRVVRMDSTVRVIRFPTDSAAERFDRVLRVRQESRARHAFVPSPVPVGGSASPNFRRSDADLYRTYAQYALWASVLLLVLGWLNLAGGLIVAVVSLATGSPVSALLWIVLAAAGCAMPLGIGCFIRMEIFRHRAVDQAGQP